MKEILLINLTRMGDLLQTTPLMAGFKDAYPGVRITLLVSSRFMEICKGIPFIDELIVFDMHGFRKRVVEKEHSLVENFRVLEELISRVNSIEYDLVMNLTHSPVSALITSMITAREIWGFSTDAEGHRLIRNPWLRYFFNVVPNRDYNPFHLVDMYLKAGDVMPEKKGLTFVIAEEDKQKADHILGNEGVSKDDICFGLHLGASKNDKTWPASSFASLADMISGEFQAKILLFGSPSEADLGREFEMTANCKPVNLIGRTSVGELAAILGKCELLISNDTGPLHLATATGTKVIDIFTSNVHFLETGPYGEGHFVIQAGLPCVPCAFDVECNNRICKDVITPEGVFDVVKYAMKKTEAFPVHERSWKDLRIYRTHFREDGLLGFYPLVRESLGRDELYRILYREMWGSRGERTLKESDTAYENICRELTSCYLLENTAELTGVLRKNIRPLEQILCLAEKGREIIGHIAEEGKRDKPDLCRLRELSGSLEAVDNEIGLTGHTNPCLRPLTAIFVFSKEALEGDELLRLAADTSAVYSEVTLRASYLLQLTRRVISFMAACGKAGSPNDAASECRSAGIAFK